MPMCNICNKESDKIQGPGLYEGTCFDCMAFMVKCKNEPELAAMLFRLSGKFEALTMYHPDYQDNVKALADKIQQQLNNGMQLEIALSKVSTLLKPELEKRAAKYTPEKFSRLENALEDRAREIERLRKVIDQLPTDLTRAEIAMNLAISVIEGEVTGLGPQALREIFYSPTKPKGKKS